ncbi:helix-turn-helix domain-containing protein [Providencia rettgeri]|nr:helix-turn-helix domain-containing protein [Providencia rettgeri]
MNEYIQKAIDLLGSQAALARACGVSQPAVFRWLNGRRVKADHVMAIVNATNGHVKPHEIRPDLPDLFPHPKGKAHAPDTQHTEVE